MIPVSYTHLDVYKRQQGSWQRYQDMSNAGRHGWLMTLVHNYLFFRVPLFHPDNFLRRMLPYVSFIYSRVFLIGFLSLVAFGLYLTSREWDSFEAMFWRMAKLQSITPVSYTHLDVYKRQIKYNQDIRVEQLGIALGIAQTNLRSADMLPGVVAGTDYFGRNNLALSRSNVSSVYSTSSDQNNVSSNISLSWNILDFGLSYVRAQQAADKVMYQVEQRRRAVGRIIEAVSYTHLDVYKRQGRHWRQS